MEEPFQWRSRMKGVGWSIVGTIAVLIAISCWLFHHVPAELATKPSSPVSALRNKRIRMFSSYFPDTIPHFPVRRDVQTGKMVHRGDVNKKLSLTPGVFDFGEEHYQSKKRFEPDQLMAIHKNRVSLAEMQSAYQCAETEPDFDTSSGAVSLLRMAPVTMKTVEWMCAYAETRCVDHQSCLHHIAQFKNSAIRKADRHWSKFGIYRTSTDFELFRLLRVKNNELYYDWPWGRGRIAYYGAAKSNGSQPLRVDAVNTTYHDNAMLLNVLRILHVNDSLFFMGGERSSMPWLFPFPSFSMAPKVSDIITPVHRYLLD